MAKTQRPSGAYKNSILARLPAAQLAKLTPHLVPITLETKHVLYEPNKTIRYAYFVESGMVSVVSIMKNGRCIEVGTIGSEGMVGAVLVLTTSVVPHQYFVQIAGSGYRIAATKLKAVAEHNREMRERILHYQAAFLSQTMQTAACNGLHSIQQRCCRWLLLSHDRADSNPFVLTHEFLAIMLGVRRASVTDMLQPLQARGLIESHRGEITVLKRKGLESGSCECYQVISKQYAHLK